MTPEAAWTQDLYLELRRMAEGLMAGERGGHTLEPTALANEVWLRLRASRNASELERGAFLGLAAQAMRRILTEHARRRATAKRGGAARRTTLDGKAAAPEPVDFALDLDAALTELERLDPRARARRRAALVRRGLDRGDRRDAGALAAHGEAALALRARVAAAEDAGGRAMNRWQLQQELFEETAALEASARSRVLRERAGGDEELVRRVERLVAADAHPLAALEGTAADLWLALRDEPAPETLCSTTFGPYRVDAYLTSGGMAHVYRATRTSAGTERRVALKVLRPVLAGEDFLARFQRERETLAALEHEHVVAFLDAGALPDGLPFLVMEYVEGTPLTTWGRGVPLRRRLELFLQVLAAVQYAHQKLVLHRDLKPSNVLVTAQGVPKLLDFGVATALEPAREGAGVPGPLTPGYASPEQLRGDAVTTASDVYSLGVLLRELATGDAGAAGDGAERARRSLGGDLAAIVQKALAPAPARALQLRRRARRRPAPLPRL